MERSVCIVVGCRNSSAKWAGQRYICGPHWRPIPKAMKRVHRRTWAIFEKARQARDEPRMGRAIDAFNWNWKRLERAAQEKAVGIA